MDFFVNIYPDLEMPGGVYTPKQRSIYPRVCRPGLAGGVKPDEAGVQVRPGLASGGKWVSFVCCRLWAVEPGEPQANPG